MRVLFATSEASPLVKTGGLGDVASALPRALRAAGVDARLLIPGYPAVLEGLRLKPCAPQQRFLAHLPEVVLFEGTWVDDETPVIVVACAPLFEREGGPYQGANGRDWTDNAERFGLLSKVAATLGSTRSPLAWQPDIVHCNDWQTGLTAAYLAFDPARVSRSIMTVHNLAFSGGFPSSYLRQLELPPEHFHLEGYEFYGQLSFLKAGLNYADFLTTVSPTYATEIQSPSHGNGFDGLLRHRRADLRGILNGIDVLDWDPVRDRLLAFNYDASTLSKKADNKAALQLRLGLTVDPHVPLLGVICRITPQKGVDLITGAMHHLSNRSHQLAFLGSGAHSLEQQLFELAASDPSRYAFVRGFDEALARNIEAGADMFLMPSRFEPCGLNQMYSMRYGTPPVVHYTGGLADTVVPASADNIGNGTATGFVFEHADVTGLTWAINQALDHYEHPEVWQKIQRAGMARDFSWGASAQAYRAVYESVLERFPVE